MNIETYSNSVVFVRAHPVIDEPRMTKEVHSLVKNGFQVSILAWDRKGLYKKFECSNGRTIYRLHFNAPFGKWVIPAYYPFYWLWVLLKLIRINPSVVHACDLDTVFPALLYKFLGKGRFVIFDMFDSHAMTLLQKSKLIGQITLFFERFSARMSNAVICVSKWEFALLFSGLKLKRIEVIENLPDLSLLPQYEKSLVPHKRIFRLVFAGTIDALRGISELSQAIKDLNDVELLIAGRISDPKIFETLTHLQQIKYFGPVDYPTALSLEASADVLPVLYDLNSAVYKPQAKGISPNKLYEAMMFGIPIVTNLNNPILTVDCGIIVKYNDVTAIKNAIIYLKNNPETRQELGQNGKLAYEQKFNWKLMEKKLVTLYKEMVEDKQN